MKEYERIEIQDICTRICSGGTPKSTVDEYYGGDIPWLNTKEVNFNRIHSTEKTITEKGLQNSSAKWIDENAVIIAMYGATAGKSAISKIPLTTNQACCNLNVDPSKADYRFVYYALYNEYNRLASLANGGAQQNLNAMQIKEFDIPYPSIEEQTAIADFLTALDDKIELNKRINDNLEKELQAIYLEYFDNTSTTNLGDVVKTASGGTPSRSHQEYYGGEHKWVKSKELCGSFLINTEETITTTAISKSAAKLLPEKSILIAMYGATVGEYAIIAEEMTCNQAICALIPNEDYPYTYLFMVAKNKKEELINSAIGSAQQNISQVLIRNIEISNDINKIKEFHQIAVPYFEIIEKNQKENSNLNSIRDIVLPKLMSGDLKINEIDC